MSLSARCTLQIAGKKEDRCKIKQKVLTLRAESFQAGSASLDRQENQSALRSIENWRTTNRLAAGAYPMQHSRKLRGREVEGAEFHFN